MNYVHDVIGTETVYRSVSKAVCAMRVAYVGKIYDDYNVMQEMATRTTEVSHNHTEEIKESVVTAICIWMARHGKSKEKI